MGATQTTDDQVVVAGRHRAGKGRALEGDDAHAQAVDLLQLGLDQLGGLAQHRAPGGENVGQLEVAAAGTGAIIVDEPLRAFSIRRRPRRSRIVERAVFGCEAGSHRFAGIDGVHDLLVVDQFRNRGAHIGIGEGTTVTETYPGSAENRSMNDVHAGALGSVGVLLHGDGHDVDFTGLQSVETLVVGGNRLEHEAVDIGPRLVPVARIAVEGHLGAARPGGEGERSRADRVAAEVRTLLLDRGGRGDIGECFGETEI